MNDIEIRIDSFIPVIIGGIVGIYVMVIASHGFDKRLCPVKNTRFMKYTGLSTAASIGCYLGEEVNE